MLELSSFLVVVWIVLAIVAAAAFMVGRLFRAVHYETAFMDGVEAMRARALQATRGTPQEQAIRRIQDPDPVEWV